VEDREKAKREYLKGKSLKDIAAEIGVKYDTVRQWKVRGEWPNVVTKRRHNKNQCDSATSEKKEKQEITNPLNDKQQLFCEYYVKEFNATQAYLKSYNCDYNTARTNGCLLLTKPNIRVYIQSLKEIKKQSIMVDVDDIVEKMMRVAFADIGNYVTFGRRKVPVMGPFGPIIIKDEETGAKCGLSKTVNYVDINESWTVDTSLIAEISQGKDGVKVKLIDQAKAIEWLSKYFNAFPLDKHKIEYDKAKQELDRQELERKKKADESGNW